MEPISPKYLMDLSKNIQTVLNREYSFKKDIEFYLKKWQKDVLSRDNTIVKNFRIRWGINNLVDLPSTLDEIDQETLLKIAVDLGIETPDFIPSIPVFKNEIKASYSSASSAFEKAIKQIHDEPDLAIGLANSALESIVKEILNNEKVNIQLKNNETLYSLISSILKCFELYPDSDVPKEINLIGSGLLKACQSIEKIRSEKTGLHGKIAGDYIIDDPMYAYFVVNSVATVGLFLKNYFEKKILSVNDTDNSDTNLRPF